MAEANYKIVARSDRDLLPSQPLLTRCRSDRVLPIHEGPDMLTYAAPWTHFGVGWGWHMGNEREMPRTIASYKASMRLSADPKVIERAIELRYSTPT
jgi:hypothetical protein